MIDWCTQPGFQTAGIIAYDPGANAFDLGKLS